MTEWKMSNGVVCRQWNSVAFVGNNRILSGCFDLNLLGNWSVLWETLRKKCHIGCRSGRINGWRQGTKHLEWMHLSLSFSLFVFDLHWFFVEEFDQWIVLRHFPLESKSSSTVTEKNPFLSKSLTHLPLEEYPSSVFSSSKVKGEVPSDLSGKGSLEDFYFKFNRSWRCPLMSWSSVSPS